MTGVLGNGLYHMKFEIGRANTAVVTIVELERLEHKPNLGEAWFSVDSIILGVVRSTE